MAQGKTEMGLVLVVIVALLLCGRAAAQSSSCTSVLVNLSPCLDYITGNSSTPSPGCCTQLGRTVRSQPQCLCQVLNGGGGGSSLGISINRTQALALPAACNLNAPSISQCNKAASSPANSPAESPNSDHPSGTGSRTDDGSSTGNSINLSIPLFFILFAATYASTFSTY